MGFHEYFDSLGRKKAQIKDSVERARVLSRNQEHLDSMDDTELRIHNSNHRIGTYVKHFVPRGFPFLFEDDPVFMKLFAMDSLACEFDDGTLEIRQHYAESPDDTEHGTDCEGCKRLRRKESYSDSKTCNFVWHFFRRFENRQVGEKEYNQILEGTHWTVKRLEKKMPLIRDIYTGLFEALVTEDYAGVQYSSSFLIPHRGIYAKHLPKELTADILERSVSGVA